MLHDMTFWAMFATSQQTVQTSFIHHQSWPRARGSHRWWLLGYSHGILGGVEFPAVDWRGLLRWRAIAWSELWLCLAWASGKWSPPAVVVLTGWVTVKTRCQQVNTRLCVYLMAGDGKTTFVDTWKTYNFDVKKYCVEFSKKKNHPLTSNWQNNKAHSICYHPAYYIGR